MNNDDPYDCAFFLLKKATALAKSGEYSEAKAHYKKSIRFFPTAEAYTYLGWVYGLEGHYYRAISCCKFALKIDPTFGNAYNDIGAYLFSLERYDDAIDWFEQAKEATRYTTRYFPYLNLGRLYVHVGNISKAKQEFLSVLKVVPYQPEVFAFFKLLWKQHKKNQSTTQNETNEAWHRSFSRTLYRLN